MMDKKAFFTDPIIAVFSFIALILIFIIFNVIFGNIADDREFDIGAVSSSYDSKIALMQIMRMPVMYKNHETDVAGLIIFAENDNTGRQMLRPMLKDAMQTFADNKGIIWMYVKISYDEDDFFFVQVTAKDIELADHKADDKEGRAVLVLPGVDGSLITVEGRLLR